ncbi:hypothetical protein SAMN02745664_1098 [Moraxella cuniculi DSM 21768]|uniref:2OG-Fe dioxygenase n=1 Tax=Moraxella cuniculi DSM 21768 TaxID=1122245 RepID=A0A1N7F171_9GAMM|nr:2OG-Fe dioxygenase family protein [Moraxella cuniculi]OOS05070.1 hypothetical protein B0189_07870 [Moraxella cuniculi]SIR94067.1 hypothetical protein SAMN02745664_1098 [Moraxella cuniculi DSM 21768]
MSDVLLMKLGKLDKQAICAVQPSFDELKSSNYKDGAYRFRKYSKLAFAKGQLTVLPSDGFVQTGKLNEFQGDVLRCYENLSEQTVQSDGFGQICHAFVKACNLPSNCQLEVHQMRIIAQDNSTPAEATPEGVHQDGFDFVGVFTIARHNQQGGALMLWQHKTDDTPLACVSPEPADYCIINDRTLWHSASSVSIANKDDVGYWDLFVVTANRPN